MPKSSAKQMRIEEQKIINELRKHGKESIDAVAKRCGFSRQKVWRIIKRFEKDKVIWNYSAVFDDEKIGVKRYVILVKRNLKPITEDILNTALKGEIRNQMEKLGIMIDTNYLIQGEYDLILTVTAPGIKELKVFCNRFSSVFNEHIDEMHIQEVIFPIQRSNAMNPDLYKLRDFF